MPIHDQSYRHWEGKLKSHSFRWWTIAYENLKVVLRRKLFIILILVPAVIQFFVFGGLIYGVNTYGFFSNLSLITPEFFFRFCFQQTFFILLICVFGGSGLISNDLKSNALQLYLSKPLTRLDYAVGKIATIFIMLECITLVPGILLFLEHSVLSQDTTFIREQYWIIGSIFLYSLILSIPITFLTLALSSITKNNRFAAIILITIVFGTTVLNGMLWVIFRARWTHFISYWNNIEMLGRELFGISKSPTDWQWATPIILILTLVCVWIMYRKIKGIEIVT
jgi:ABC-type transport system involved in multi-copper enzyme maturation permease subunit